MRRLRCFIALMLVLLGIGISLAGAGLDWYLSSFVQGSVPYLNEMSAKMGGISQGSALVVAILFLIVALFVVPWKKPAGK